jgi:MFS family permease
MGTPASLPRQASAFQRLRGFRETFRPDQVNEHGQVVDETVLKKTRIKVSIAACLGLLPNSLGFNFITGIIKLFGGNDFHLGLAGGVGNIYQVLQFLGSLVLRFARSNRFGYLIGALPGIAVGMLSIVCIYHADTPFRAIALKGYLALLLCGAVFSAITANIYISWIGDLVPKNRLGWFFSLKWIFVNLSAVAGSLTLARIVDAYPTAKGYSAVSFFLFLSAIAGLLLFMSVPDRRPKSASFFSAGGEGGRLHYRSPALWCYILFYIIWGGGRSILSTFTPIFLMERFGFSMSKLAWLFSLQLVSSSIMIYILGKISDKRGNRIILILTSGFVAACMFLNVSAAWWGLAPIIIYAILNGMAGQTHSMLAINLAIEIFPDHGRSAYLALSRFFIGIACILAPFFSGWIMSLFQGMHLDIWGRSLDRYYLAFAASGALTLCCVIPLIIMGRRRV